MQQALLRYAKIIKDSALGYNVAPYTPTVGVVQQLRINLTKDCEALPHSDMDESCKREALKFSFLIVVCSSIHFVKKTLFADYIKDKGSITANSIWGILHGLETLSQILVPMPNGMVNINSLHFIHNFLVISHVCLH